MGELKEQWKPIPGWEDKYEVSDQGRVRSKARLVGSRWRSYRRPVKESILTPYPNTFGHYQVRLCDASASRMRLVHRLVLESFVGPCPEGMEGCHCDGDPTNNAIANLRWDTPSSNQLDKVRHGTHPNAAKTECLRGHPFDSSNTYIGPDGKRQCRACRSLRRDLHNQKKRTTSP